MLLFHLTFLEGSEKLFIFVPGSLWRNELIKCLFPQCYDNSYGCGSGRNDCLLFTVHPFKSVNARTGSGMFMDPSYRILAGSSFQGM